MSYYDGVLPKSISGLVLATGLFYSSGCATNRPSSDQHMNLAYEISRNRALMSEQQRYDLETKENSKHDLVNHIDPDLVESVQETRDALESTITALLPKNPRIKGSKVVWEMSWESLKDKFEKK